jgi:hypothetical protein
MAMIGEIGGALPRLRSAVTDADAVGDTFVAGYSNSFLGWAPTQHIDPDPDAAVEACERSLRWIGAFGDSAYVMVVDFAAGMQALAAGDVACAAERLVAGRAATAGAPAF